MTTPFSIEWTYDDGALYRQHPELPPERIRLLYFNDAAAVWANLIHGWPPNDDGSPLKLPDGSAFRLRIRAVFEKLKGGASEDKARVDVDEVQEHQVAGFPSRGTIRIDLADIDELLDDSARFKQTVVHEIGHVLGLGTLFDSVGLVRDKTSNPVYTGKQGMLEFAALLGRDEGKGIDVPLEAEKEGTTRAFHWDERALRLDIMSPILDQPFAAAVGGLAGVGQSSVISTVSAGALVDLGYVVNMLRAEKVQASL